MISLMMTTYGTCRVLGTILGALHILTHLILINLITYLLYIISILQTKKYKNEQREVKKLAQGHTTRKWLSQ